VKETAVGRTGWLFTVLTRLPSSAPAPGLLHMAPRRERGMTPAHQNAADTPAMYPGWDQPAPWAGYQSLDAPSPFHVSLGSYPRGGPGPPPPAWPRAQYCTGAAPQHWYTGGIPCGFQAPPSPERPSSVNPNTALAAWLAAGRPAPGGGGSGVPPAPACNGALGAHRGCTWCARQRRPPPCPRRCHGYGYASARGPPGAFCEPPWRGRTCS